MTRCEGQARALLLALGAVEESLPQLLRQEWTRYARERFAVPSAKELAARLALQGVIAQQYDRMRKQAARAQRELPFSAARLKFFALKSLECACPFCDDSFGVLNLGIVWDVPPSSLAHEPFALLNVVACCDLCARGKGALSGASWLDVLQALRTADDGANRQAREAIALGREVGQWPKVLP